MKSLFVLLPFFLLCSTLAWWEGALLSALICPMQPEHSSREEESVWGDWGYWFALVLNDSVARSVVNVISSLHVELRRNVDLVKGDFTIMLWAVSKRN